MLEAFVFKAFSPKSRSVSKALSADCSAKTGFTRLGVTIRAYSHKTRPLLANGDSHIHCILFISIHNMKNACRLFRRKNGYYYLEDNNTGRQNSLGTDDMLEARKLLAAANDNRQAADLNLHLGKTYLAHADPTAAKRTWQDAINELCSHGKVTTQQRYAREFRSKAYDLIRKKPLIQTTADELQTVLKRGTNATNRALRILHNFALNNGWLHWQILSKKQWPIQPSFVSDYHL